jgi:alpha-1,2-mannosyltransferase
MAAALIATLDRRDGWAGALIVLAASIKISPILLLGFFIAQKRTRVWLGVILSSLIVLALMIVTVGWEAVWYFITSILPIVSRGSASYPNQSLLGAIYRFVVPAVAIDNQSAMGDYPAARLVWLIISALLLAMTFYLVVRSDLQTPASIAVAFSAFSVLGLLIGSLAWDHYLLWLVVPMVAVVVDWFQTRWLRAAIFWLMLITGLLAINIPTPLQADLYSSLGPIGTSLSTWGMMVVLLLIWRRLMLMQRSRSLGAVDRSGI